MSKVVVFDFDKTLTKRDTLLDFFLFQKKINAALLCKIIIYFGCMILFKLHIINNFSLKSVGVYLFLNSIGRQEFLIKCRAFANSNKVKFSKLYYTYNFVEGEKYYVVTASFEDYVKAILPEHFRVIGSNLSWDENDTPALGMNCYKENKLKRLMDIGVYFIDNFYTDSYDDICLAKESTHSTIVSGDALIQCASLDDFIKYFKK